MVLRKESPGLTEKENFGLLKIGTLIKLCRTNETIVRIGNVKGLFLNTPKRAFDPFDYAQGKLTSGRGLRVPPIQSKWLL